MLASILRGLKDDVVVAGQRRLRDGEAVALGDAGKSLLCLGQLGEHTPVEPTLEPLLRRGRPEHMAGAARAAPVPAGHPHVRVAIEGLEGGLAEAAPFRQAKR